MDESRVGGMKDDNAKRLKELEHGHSNRIVAER
jgi:hypothetical protein